MDTCCCPCNLSRSVWGLTKYLVTEHNYEGEELKKAILEWLHFTRSKYYLIKELKRRGIDLQEVNMTPEPMSCFRKDVKGCELPFKEGGCGGMTVLKM